MVYTLSNHNQNVMSGLWKDLPYKITKKVKENWLDNLFFLVPLVGTYQCVPVSRQPCAARVRVAAGGTVLDRESEGRAAGFAAARLSSPLAAREAPLRRRPHAAAAGRAAARQRLSLARPTSREETLGLLGASQRRALTLWHSAGMR